jgi:type II restriction/modification system DNA methylase subunit YeeA
LDASTRVQRREDGGLDEMVAMVVVTNGYVTGSGSPGPEARKFLVSSEKEFNDRHRGDKQEQVNECKSK